MTRLVFLVAAYPVLAIPLNCLAQDPDALPIGWDRVGPPQAVALYQVGLDREIRHGGQASLRIRFVGPTPSEYGTVVSQSFLADDFRGQRVRLVGHTRTADADGMGRLWIRVDGSHLGTPFDNMSDRAVTGTTEWTRHELVVDVPSDASVVHLGAIFSGGGTLWIDDLEFGRSDASTAVTGVMREVVQRPPADPSLPRVPVNLKFEADPGP